MKAYSIIISILALIALGSCKKEEQIIDDNGLSTTPVFSVTGLMPEGQMNLVAGENGGFMETYTLEQNRIPVFYGELTDYNLNYFKLGMHIGNPVMFENFINNPADTIRFLKPWSGAYFQFVKESLVNTDSINSIHWSVNGESTTSEDLTISDPGYYTLCATIEFNDGQQKEVCNDYLLGYSDFYHSDISFDISESSQLQAWVNSDVGISSVNWYLDNNNLGSGSGTEAVLASGLHVLRADIQLTNGLNIQRSVIVSGSNHEHYFDDLDGFLVDIDPSYLNDYKLGLEVKSKGVLYQLANADGQAYMLIDKLEYFGLNSSNNEVYKVTARIHVPLQNIAGGEAYSTNFEISFGFEIPN